MGSPNPCDELTRLLALKALSSSTPGRPSNPSRFTTHCASLKVWSPSGAHNRFVLSCQPVVLSILFFLLLRRNWFLSSRFNSVMYFYPSVQFPSTSARLQMVDAAIYVFFPRVGNTNVLAPQIFTWPLTIKPASPTAPPVRSASVIFHPTFTLTV